MNFTKRASQVLLAIVLLNIISTGLHYTDNALFIEQYPGPAWLTPKGILATVLLMTPIGLLGYWFYTKRILKLAYLLLGFYSITGLSSPVHYLFPMTVPMSVKMHSLIWLDGASGALLVGFISWSIFVAKEWKNTQIVDQTHV